MPDHPPEPWRVEPSDEHEGRYEIDHDAAGSVTGCDGLFLEVAERIVACVNHLKGVPTSLLEKAAMMAEMFPCKPGDITPRYCEALILLMTGRRCKVTLLDENEAMSMDEFLDGFIEYVRRNPWSSH